MNRQVFSVCSTFLLLRHLFSAVPPVVCGFLSRLLPSQLQQQFSFFSLSAVLRRALFAYAFLYLFDLDAALAIVSLPLLVPPPQADQLWTSFNGSRQTAIVYQLGPLHKPPFLDFSRQPCVLLNILDISHPQYTSVPPCPIPPLPAFPCLASPVSILRPAVVSVYTANSLASAGYLVTWTPSSAAHALPDYNPQHGEPPDASLRACACLRAPLCSCRYIPTVFSPLPSLRTSKLKRCCLCSDIVECLPSSQLLLLCPLVATFSAAPISAALVWTNLQTALADGVLPCV